MKIGVLSDTHDNSSAVESALRQFRLRRVELIIHCGDIQSPETIRRFAELPTHFVFGNCDWQPDALTPVISDIGAKIYQPFGEIELGGKRIAWLHSHDLKLFLSLEFSDQFDYLFYGHTHKAEQHRRGKTLVVNPGALYRVKNKTCLILDSANDELETLEIA